MLLDSRLIHDLRSPSCNFKSKWAQERVDCVDVIPLPVTTGQDEAATISNVGIQGISVYFIDVTQVESNAAGATGICNLSHCKADFRNIFIICTEFLKV